MTADSPQPTPKPDLLDAIGQIGANARAEVDAVLGTGKALRDLALAELALARAALGRSLVLAAIALVFAVVASVMLTTALVAALVHWLHLSWPVALVAVGGTSLLLALLCLWLAMRYLAHTRFTATRKQLGLLRKPHPPASESRP